MFSIRSKFIKQYFETLLQNNLELCVMRGYLHIFDEVDKDIDILMDPTSFIKAKKIFSELCKAYGGVLLTDCVCEKSLYLKLMLSEKIDGKIVFSGVYIHAVGYLTIKTNYAQRNKKYRGEKVWLSDVKIKSINCNGADISIPEPQYELLFLLVRYSQRQKNVYVSRIRELIEEKEVIFWLSNEGTLEKINEITRLQSSEVDMINLYGLIEDTYSQLVKKSSIKFEQITKLIMLNISSLFSIKGRLIFFSGPDGSGKTSANEFLSKILREKLKVRVLNSKHIYPLSNRISSKGQKIQAKLRGVDEKDKNSLERDRGDSFKWYLRRLLGLVFLLLQIHPGYVWARYKNWQGYTLIIDTSCFDAFVKGHRPRFKFLERVAAPLIPCGDAWFVMTAQPEEIVARKPELTINEIEDYYARLSCIVAYSGCSPVTIESNEGVNVAVDKILKFL